MIVEVKGFSKLIWGTFLLLAAAFIISNQVGGFVELSFWSILVAALALAYIVQCMFRLYFASLPIPLAILYITFQPMLEPHIAIPHINMWMLLLAAVLATLGLHTLLPKRKKKRHHAKIVMNRQAKPRTEVGGDDNNPHISIQFGGISRYLHSECLETVQIDCKFGSLEVYFDQVKLSPNGAEAFCDCSFGSITLYVPKEWQIIDELDRAFSGVEYEKRRTEQEQESQEEAPKLILRGNAKFSGIDIRYV